ncbi:MAG TPA: hypothetical protein VHQ90_26530 [Thermoanaerobaculia bacterium]|nr:hypothetical protein [Thermoanaerobaculia bacterium]
MPVLPITDENGELHLFAPTEVLAVMLHPNDEPRRDDFRVWGLAHNILNMEDEEKRTKVLQASAELLVSTLFRLPDQLTFLRRTIKYAGSSWVAGEMLLFMLSAALHHPQHESGPTQAVYTMSRTHRGRTFGGEAAAVKARTLWKAWSRFKSAAHLVAVRQIALQDQQEMTPDLMEMITRLLIEDLPVFLATSEGLRQLGERHRILDGRETWRVPDNLDLPPAKIEVPPLPASALEVLASYRPEYARDLPPE